MSELVAGLGERKSRLHRIARRLRPQPTALPYYLHSPLSRAEPAPGWYMTPAGVEHPVYLGHSAVDAELSLREMLQREGVAA